MVFIKVWSLAVNKSEDTVITGGGDSVLNIWKVKCYLFKFVFDFLFLFVSDEMLLFNFVAESFQSKQILFVSSGCNGRGALDGRSKARGDDIEVFQILSI